MTLKTSDFFYHLPNELIAQTPVTPRDCSRMLVYDRQTEKVSHKVFKDILNIFNKGDLLVVNNTRVIPARLSASDKNGRVYEVLLLKRLDYNHWEALLKPAKKAKIGTMLTVNEELSITIKSVTDNGVRVISCAFQGIFEDILSRTGSMPLPPYITEKLTDKERYNTVYAEVDGSSAAPTAGLHFTPELLTALKNKGVEVAEVLLEVGLGTFRPVKVENINNHNMHAEYYEISEGAANAINRAKSEGRRIIAVGTTTVRTLESAANADGMVTAKKGDTDIFIYPPYKPKVIDALITNFHLPESTLIMLVSAFIGRENTLSLYNLAVREQYRFFSFGDAMLIL